MTSFRAAAASGDDWPSVCEDCLSALDPLPPGTNFGMVYVSGAFAHAIDLITARLTEATGVDSWIGTGGVQVCAGASLPLGDDAISLLTAALPKDGFRLFDGLADPGSDEPLVIPSTHAALRDDHAAGLAIVHGDPRQNRMPALIERLGETTGAFLVGGLSSANANGAMQIAGRPTEGGLSGVLMSADIPAITGLTQGCTPIGPVREISAMDGPWIAVLDGRPALDELKEDVGPMLARTPERMSGFILAARQESGPDRTDYLVRDLAEFDPLRGYVMVGDDLRPGDRLCFVKRDPEAARADLKRLCADLRRRAEGRTILGALYHSSIGRGRHLFGSEGAEAAIIDEELGALPLSGLRCNGEVFRDRLYGYSAVLTLFLDGDP